MYIGLTFMTTIVACVMWHPLCGDATFPFIDQGPPYYVSHDIMRCKYSSLYPLPWLIVIGFFANLLQCRCTWHKLQSDKTKTHYFMSRLAFETFATLSALGLAAVVQYDYMAWDNMHWKHSPKSRHYAGVSLLMFFFAVVHCMIYNAFVARCIVLNVLAQYTVRREKFLYEIVELAYVSMGIVFVILQILVLHTSSVWVEYSILLLMAIAFVLNVQVAELICRLDSVDTCIPPYPTIAYAVVYVGAVVTLGVLFQVA